MSGPPHQRRAVEPTSVRQMRIRLVDLAEQAGVSTATVSRVLNGKSGVSAAAHEQVLTALDQLGYERPPRLSAKTSELIGLIVPELENPIFPAFAQAIEGALSRNGYTPLLCTQRPGGITEDEYVAMLLEHKVAGIIFVSGLHADSSADTMRYQRIVSLGLPIVLINGYNKQIDVPFVSDDDLTAMDLAVGHLMSLGHKDIGLAIGPERFVPTQRKIEGFTRAISRRTGHAPAPGAVNRSLFSVEGGHAAAGQLLDEGMTAIICGSDLMALGAIRAVADRGLRVPDDVSVVGYDDSPLISFTNPPLTTVRQSVRAMGEAAVTMLIEEIQGIDKNHNEFLFRPELIVRGSTGAAPSSSHARPSAHPHG